MMSLFIGVSDVTLSGVLSGNREQLQLLLISRIPRLLAILCTGIGMSVAGLIMQQLCMNKFVSPTTGATLSSAQLGILLALVIYAWHPRCGAGPIFAFIAAIAGTWLFVCFIQRIQFKDVVMVPLVGIMFGNVIGGMTSYLAYKYDMTQALSSWLVGTFLPGAAAAAMRLVYLALCRLVLHGLSLCQSFQYCWHGEEISRKTWV